MKLWSNVGSTLIRDGAKQQLTRRLQGFMSLGPLRLIQYHLFISAHTNVMGAVPMETQ